MKKMTKFIIAAGLLVSANVNAALVNISINGNITRAENYGGLTAFVDTITADITLDDTGLTGIGSETVAFTGSNTLNISAGTLSFDQSMDSNASTSITFLDGKLFDLNFGAIYGTNGAPEDFNSSLTSVTASRSVTTGKGGNAVTTDYTLYAVWDNQAQLISSVPVPAAVWLFGSGLLGLIGVARRKQV